jgi:hypothetical protein
MASKRRRFLKASRGDLIFDADDESGRLLFENDFICGAKAILVLLPSLLPGA